MKPVKFNGQTKVLGKPYNMTDDECSGLPVQETTSGIYSALESVWELTEEDLKVINESKRIRLGVIGNGMPPVYMVPEPKE